MNQIVELARLVQKRQLKLTDIPEAQRQQVAGVLGSMSDGQAAQIAWNQERRTKQLGRSTVRSRHFGS